jgi:hypothetical protein
LTQTFLSLAKQATLHAYRLAYDADYRAFSLLRWQLERKQRYADCNAGYNGWQLCLPDAASFLSTFEEIFVERIFSFPFAGGRLRILDVGANIHGV